MNDETGKPLASSASVLIVEDDQTLKPRINEMIRRISPRSQVDWATNAEQALRLIKGESGEIPKRYDVIMTDMKLKGEMSGLELANAVRAWNQDAQVMLTTADDPGVETVLPFPVLPKPFAFKDFRRFVTTALHADAAIADEPPRVLPLLVKLPSRARFQELTLQALVVIAVIALEVVVIHEFGAIQRATMSWSSSQEAGPTASPAQPSQAPISQMPINSSTKQTDSASFPLSPPLVE